MVAIGVLLASILAFFGEWWWLLDLIANFRVQLVVVGVAVVLGGLALRIPSVAVIGATLIAVNLVPIAPLYLGASADGEQTDLRVVSYNLLFSTTEESDEVIDWLKDLEADVVFLQEAGRRWVTLLGRADLPWEMVGPVTRPGEVFGTLALVPQGADAAYIDLGERAAVEVTLDAGGQTITLLGVHLISPYDSFRSDERNDELLAIGEWAATQDGPAAIVGDFNSTPFTWAFRRMLELGGLENSQSGFGVQATWPTGNFVLRVPIDHLVHSGGLEVIDRRVLQSYGSDHLPIAIDLALRG